MKSQLKKLSAPLMLAALLAAPLPLAAQGLDEVIGGVAQALLNQEVEKRAFSQAQSQNTVAAYRAYLNQFPNGANAAAAQRALDRLGGGAVAAPPLVEQPSVTTPAAVEAQLHLTRAQRVTVQQHLTSLGYSTGGADGLWGRNTRDAIRKWQSAKGYPVTGYLTAREFEVLGKFSGSSSPPAAGNGAQMEENLLGLTRNERREIQRRLTQSGYNTYGTDGVFGRNSRAALSDWQRDMGEPVTGYITADQLRDLRRQTGG